MQDNAEKIATQKNAWYKRNRKRLDAKGREYRKAHIEDIRKYYREYVRVWRIKNRVSYLLSKRVSQQNRRIGLGTMDVKIVQRVYEDNIKRYGILTCELCGRPVEFGQDSIDHKHPVVRRSSYKGLDINEYENLCVAHGNKSVEQCNTKKKDKTLEEWFSNIERT